MTRTLRPIGPVTPKLQAAGYRQYAAIFVDGKQVRNAAVLSKQVDDKIKFVGHWIDSNGEVHTTKPMVDMKRAAGRIMAIIEQAPAPAPKPAAKPAAPKRKPAPRSTTVHSTEPDSPLIDCPGCGFLHRDDAMCV